MKRKIFSVLLILTLVLSFGLVAPVSAVSTLQVVPFALDTSVYEGTHSATSEWSGTQANDGSLSVDLNTGGSGTGAEAKIIIDASDVGVTDLNSLSSISWLRYSVSGYAPHIDVIVDAEGGVDALVFEYAYNGHLANGQPTYGTEYGVWYSTFADSGDVGSSVIDGSAEAWLNSGPAGGPGIIKGTLSDWKAGIVDSSVMGSSTVLRFEIEVDNWLAVSESYIDSVEINGVICFGSIQDAIDAAESGDTIAVASGTYIEDLDISTSVNLVGTDATIKGVALGEWGSTTFPNINVMAAGASISGFTIQGPEPEPPLFAAGLIVGAPNVEIYDNDFVLNSAVGGDDIGQAIVSYNKLAIPDVDVSGLSIHDNAITSIGDGGFGYEAIYINRDTGEGSVSIVGNTISGVVARGITVERSNVMVTDNALVTAGLAPEAYNLAGVQAIDYSSGGPSSQSGIVITGNSISGFSPSVRNGALVTGTVVEGNSLESVQGDSTLNAEDNWWGHSSGPDEDAVSGLVDVEPWLLVEGGEQYDKTLALNPGWSIVSADAELSSYDIVDSVGLVYAYAYNEEGEGGFVQATELDPITPVFIKTADGGGIGFNYAAESMGIFSTDLEAGWNLIGIPETVADAGDILSSIRLGANNEVALATLASQGAYNPSGASFYESMLDIEYAPEELFPFDGYWAYMNVAKEFGVIVVTSP